MEGLGQQEQIDATRPGRVRVLPCLQKPQFTYSLRLSSSHHNGCYNIRTGVWSAISQAAQLTTFVYQASSAVWNYRWYAFPRGVTRPSIGLTHEQTVVHPLVLLSVTDHHARTVQRNSSKRVIGILLGQDNGKTVKIGRAHV